MTGLTLVVGGTGGTDRRVARRLEALGAPMRIGSRAGQPRFDWERTDGVRRALGRPPRDFAEYAREAAATGVWNEVVTCSPR